jgi:hypothetical protein
MEQMVDDYLVRFRKKRFSKPGCCQVCRGSGRLRWHGSYLRRLITMTAVYSIPIRRLFCALCRHTFALIPPFVEKFHHYAKEVIRRALRMLKSRTYEAVAGMFVGQEDHRMAILSLHFWRRKFA